MLEEFILSTILCLIGLLFSLVLILRIIHSIFFGYIVLFINTLVCVYTFTLPLSFGFICFFLLFYTCTRMRLFKCLLYLYSCCCLFIYYDVFLVDGVWCPWQDDGECSKSCGGGTVRQTRSCTCPAPSCDGEQCQGEEERYVPCNEQCCPGNNKITRFTCQCFYHFRNVALNMSYFMVQFIILSIIPNNV